MDREIGFASWDDLTSLQRQEVSTLKISDRQVEYAGPIHRAVATCSTDLSGDVLGAAILRNDVIAGFLLLKRDTAAPAWALTGSAVISALRIDLRFQGLGIGTTALRLLPEWILGRWPETACIMLSVDEENEPGIRSYSKSGWTDLGLREQGWIGWVRYMKRDLRSVRSFDSP